MITSQIPPIPPAPSQTPPAGLAEAVGRYLRARQIWQPFGTGYALNDVYSRQVRRDTLRFGIGQRYRVGMA